MFQNCGISSTRILRMMRPTRVVRSSPFESPNRSVFFRVSPHRAKLRQDKRAAVFADSFLFVKDRTPRLEFDENRGHDDDRQSKNRADQRGEPVHGVRASVENLFWRPGPVKISHDGRIMLNDTRSGDAFVKRCAFFDPNVPGQAQIQQPVSRKLPAALAHRDHDSIDVFAPDDVAQLLRSIQSRAD